MCGHSADVSECSSQHDLDAPTFLMLRRRSRTPGDACQSDYEVSCGPTC